MPPLPLPLPTPPTPTPTPNPNPPPTPNPNPTPTPDPTPNQAKAILDDWEGYLPRFWHVYPGSEKGSPEVSGVTAEETARLAAEAAKAAEAEAAVVA